MKSKLSMIKNKNLPEELKVNLILSFLADYALFYHKHQLQVLLELFGERSWLEANYSKIKEMIWSVPTEDFNENHRRYEDILHFLEDVIHS